MRRAAVDAGRSRRRHVAPGTRARLTLCDAGAMTTAEWEQRVADAWASFDDL
jgi:hypothetical protein